MLYEWYVYICAYIQNALSVEAEDETLLQLIISMAYTGVKQSDVIFS